MDRIDFHLCKDDRDSKKDICKNIMSINLETSKINLVLLPGMDGTALLFEPFLSAVADTFTVHPIAYPRDRKQSYMEIRDYILSKLPAGPFVLLGESFSGFPAYLTALSRPDGLRGVIFTATFLRSPSPFWGRLTPLLPGGLLMRKPPPLKVIQKRLLGAAASDTEIRKFRSIVMKVGPDVMWHRMKMIMTLKQPTEPLSVPVIYIRATEDALIPSRAVETVRRVAPEIAVHDVKGPHLILQTRPGECLVIIRGFCRSVLA